MDDEYGPVTWYEGLGPQQARKKRWWDEDGKSNRSGARLNKGAGSGAK